MIDRHKIQTLLSAGHTTQEVARLLGISQRTAQRVANESSVEKWDDAAERRRRRIGRRSKAACVQARLRELMLADPEAPPLEHLRVLRSEGVKLGDSTFYRVHALEKEILPAQLTVRFEGVAGEFAQFDFGEVDVRLDEGRKRRIHFAAYRLKYSRWVWVVPVQHQLVEWSGASARDQAGRRRWRTSSGLSS